MQQYFKALRLISKGIIDIDEIISTRREKRSKEQNLNLGYYLLYKCDYFKDEQFRDKDFI